MSLKNRVEKLEEQRNLQDNTLYGVLRFEEENLWIDGVNYQKIEDIPPALRLKYAPLLVGHVSGENGKVVDVVDGCFMRLSTDNEDACGPGHLQ